jgi:hypothetical protein
MTTKKTLTDKKCKSLLNDFLSGTDLAFADGQYVEDVPTYFDQLFENNPEECQNYVGKSVPNKDHLTELILASSAFQQKVKSIAKRLATDFQLSYKDAMINMQIIAEQEQEKIKEKQSEFDLVQSLSSAQKEALSKLYNIKLPNTKKAVKKTK